MNYEKHYEKLINKALNRCILPYTYKEKHHIIPRCLGGEDKDDNLVELLPEEHFLAHQLLHKIYPSHEGLLYALNSMNNTSKITNKKFRWIREKFSQMRMIDIDIDWLREELKTKTAIKISRETNIGHNVIMDRIKKYQIPNPHYKKRPKNNINKSNVDIKIDLKWLQNELMDKSISKISEEHGIDYEFLRYRVNKYKLKNPHKKILIKNMDHEEVVNLYNEGNSMKKISKILGCDPSNIKTILKTKGII